MITKQKTFLKRLLLYPYKILKSGNFLHLYLTIKCNLNCDYCGNRCYNGKMPVFRHEMTLEQWKEYIETFPGKIKRININGGEPFSKEYLSEFIEFLTKKHIFVYVYTNLSYYKEIKASYFLRFIVTLHVKQDLGLFNRNLELYKNDGHILQIFEMGKNRPFCKLELCMTPDSLRVAPDGTIFTNHFDLMEYLNLWDRRKRKFDGINKDLVLDGKSWDYK